MKRGDTIHHFEILETVELEEFKARGIWARHASGAELFHIVNDDPENLFAFAFATPPEDDTGVAHILEHSVLCGSEKYPLKDAFLVLAQGSLHTFLNAWTFSDKTVYPASSMNEKDYFNLFGVYGDAVFRPALSEWTFLQEGWRLEYAHGKNALEYSGVVYNEMKGAYSSMENYAGDWSIKAIMPDTVYAFDSGGDPAHIPELHYAGLKEFHARAYSPANCKIFLAGNIPTEKQMAFLDAEILAGLPPGKPLPLIQKAAPWEKTPDGKSRLVRVPCPGGEENKPQVFLAWLCCDTTDRLLAASLGCLGEILLGHDGSPLLRALIESGLGEDLSPVSGMESEMRETSFCAGLRGVEAAGEEGYRKIEELIMGELNRLVREGIPREEIEAALHGFEFSHREIKRAHGPYSLVWLRRALRGWLYGKKPWEALLFVPVFNEMKKAIAANSRYFEELIQKYFLDNPHRALVAVEPEEDFLPKAEAALAEKLSQIEKRLSAEEKAAMKKKAKQLEKFQSEGESPEALAAIPHLARSDLKPELQTVPRECRELPRSGGGAVPVIAHPLFTDGITYAEFAFPVDVLEPEDYPWLTFYCNAACSLGLEGKNGQAPLDYAEVSSLLALSAGDFTATLETSSPVPGWETRGGGDIAPPNLIGRDWLIFHLKALDEKFAASSELALRLATSADFSDTRRLRDLVVEMKNDAAAGISHAGHSLAAGRAGRACSRSRAIHELWTGLSQVLFAHQLADMDTAEIRDRLVSIRDRLVSRAGLIVNLTANPESIDAALKAAAAFGDFGAPREKNPRCSGEAAFAAQPAKAEVWSSPLLQIGFAALAFPAAPYGSREEAAEEVFAHELSTGALWESIRMKGGAYGVSAHPDSTEGLFSVATYRDPSPLRSLSIIPETLKKRGEAETCGDSLEKTVIGAFSREITPTTPAGKGKGDFFRYLYGFRAEDRFKRQAAIVELSPEDISAAAGRLARAAQGADGFPGGRAVIAGPREAEKAAKALGVEARKLPV